MKDIIKYVDNLEKANNMIDSLSIPKELEYYAKEIKGITLRISSVIDLIDAEFHKEFYGEEE
jgi:hypothetical protein